VPRKPCLVGLSEAQGQRGAILKEIPRLAGKPARSAGAMQGSFTTNNERICFYKIFLFFIFARQILAEEFPAVFVVMTINAEVFPIGSIRGVIEVVPIFMVNRKEMPIGVIELSSAFCADETMEFE
jgi:hypothetical protein